MNAGTRALEVERFRDGKGNIVSVERFQWRELKNMCINTDLKCLTKNKNHSEIYKLNLR